MTVEQDINRSNLIKLRIADHVLRDMIAIGPVPEDEWKCVISLIHLWADRLEALEEEASRKGE